MMMMRLNHNSISELIVLLTANTSFLLVAHLNIIVEFYHHRFFLLQKPPTIRSHLLTWLKRYLSCLRNCSEPCFNSLSFLAWFYNGQWSINRAIKPGYNAQIWFSLARPFMKWISNNGREKGRKSYNIRLIFWYIFDQKIWENKSIHPLQRPLL